MKPSGEDQPADEAKMPIIFPPVIQRPTPNYSPTLIKPDLTILHMTEGGYAGAVPWLCDPRARASAHRVMKADGSEVSQLAPMSMKAWHACAFNGRSLSLEIEGHTADGISDKTLLAAAQIAAWDCLVYDIPPVWAHGGQGRGVADHRMLGSAGGGHSDFFVDGDATASRMMNAIQAAYAELKALPALPLFALHGIPGPHEVVAPADTKPQPSHGGQPRAQPGDTHDHPTPSGFAVHSTAALQADLNALQKAGLTVDGWFGDKTREALRAFQAAHQCDVDGKVGPQTWAAIDKAMAGK
jgi:hypothetical protein